MNSRSKFAFASSAGALLMLSVLSLPATTTSPSSSSSTPTTSAYTNQPTTYVDTYVPSTSYYSSSFYDGGRYYNGSFNSTGTFFSTYYAPLFTFYFPPTPPALGSTIALYRRYGVNQPETTLPQLMPYVGEPFYAPLSAHLHREDLSKKQLARLDAYQAGRSSALADLRAKLASVKDADPTTRARTLGEFAAQQTPRLAELEIEAEAIRDSLVRGSFTQSGADWNDNRTWALGDDLRYESRVDEFKVIRASAFFAAGLSPAQRRLLREFAMELNEPVTEPTADAALDAAKPLFYFSPETARIELPSNLTPEIQAKIDAYRDAKAALKAELRAEIYKQDRAFFSFTRTRALRALAEQQSARLAALETQAEEIRLLLAGYPRPSRATLTFVSQDLANRISAYLREKQDLQRTLVDKLAAIKAELPQHRADYTRSGAGYAVEIIASRKASKSDLAKIEALRAQLVTFNATQVARYTALLSQKTQIQTELSAALKARLPAGSATDTDVLLKNFASQFTQQEIWLRYRDYDTAVFEPGLSPEQRRLLYADALVQLDLPLPRGSTQP